MATLAEQLLEYGIRPRHYDEGDQKLTCPQCSARRRNRTDPCLSLRIEGTGAVWNCHHCGWTGGVTERTAPPQRQWRRAAPVRPQRSPDDLTPAVLAWLAARGISEAVARRNRIGTARVYMPALKAEVDCIAFPYFRDGELVNIKFRALATKAFIQVKDAEAVLYGLDDIVDSKTAIIVEGECDKLALEEAGYRNAVSVPNGAQTGGNTEADSAAFAYLANSGSYLDHAERVVLAVDADEKGRALETELSRRLGRERCWRVRWPDSNDAPCKDANETLLQHGAKVLRECVENAEPYPIEGLHRASDYVDELLALYREGRHRALSTGWPALDELMTIAEGRLSVVTGIPNHGKSEFIDALAINMAVKYGWRFAVCSFENSPRDHLPKIAEKYLGQPFWEGPRPRMTEAELLRGLSWADDHFFLIRFDEEAPTFEAILAKARAAVVRYGIRGLVIDPYNEIEHRRPPTMTETEYVGQILGQVRRFAINHGLHVWFVAHPRVLRPQKLGASLPAPTLYDISGSANWSNKSDLGLVVHRPDTETDETVIYVRKVRFKAEGKIGGV
ncbi:MAG TPA: toprim domain-containing protein, partial [Candidatus Dormibacteraeota bacterium]|nr:toprim domain-containing protein [Candidatus Dormibacteraeota bacterium]